MINPRFLPRNDADVVRFISAHPLAFVVANGGAPADITLLPLRPERVTDGRIETLTGHYPRNNPQVAQLHADPRATLLFLGPNGYISPSWFSDRTQAPTWNYASANLDVRIEFLDTPQDLDRIVRDLVDAMEAGRQRAWRVEDMHARYRLLLQQIIPFRATVVDIRAKFKLGQDERDDTWPEILRGVAAGGNDALLQMMRDFNSHRDQKE
jgi:transcriptional regulator